MSEDQYNDDRTQTHVPLKKDTAVGHYRIVEKIGAGGMGEVYLADDTELERKVALKFLPFHLCGDADACERFKREARAAAALKHSNIVTVYDVGEHKGRPFFAMEYCEGQLLSDVIAQHDISLEQSVDLILHVANGLRHAHESGIIHRDIKPSNVILDSQGLPKLADFGLAQLKGSKKLTVTGSTMGTLEYMSPEQVEGKVLDARSDLFSLGVILYEMICARRPFTGEYRQAISHSILHEEPEPLRRFKSGVPDELQRIVSKLLQKDPQLRYQSAAGLISDLNQLKATGLKQARRPGTRPRWLRAMLPAALVIFVVLALVLKPWKFEISSTDEVEARTRRLAVLQLKNLGAPEDDYISYGITEDLIVDLTRLGTIGVAPMRTVMKYKESDEDLQTIANDLNADLILEGSIRRSEDSVYVSATLTDITSDANVWADRWAESDDDLPRIKSVLATKISRALSIDSIRIKTAQVDATDTENPQAYEYYLRAKYLVEHSTEESDLDAAQDLLRKAYDLDSTFLAARSAGAEIHYLRGDFAIAEKELLFVLSESRRRNVSKEEAASLTGLAYLYISLGDLDKGRSYGSQALTLSLRKGYLDLEQSMLVMLIDIHRSFGDYDSASAMLDRVKQIARELGDEDRAVQAGFTEAAIYLDRGQITEAKALFEEFVDKAIADNRRAREARARSSLGAVHMSLGEYDQALQQFESALRACDDLGFERNSADIMCSISEVHSARGDYRKGLQYAEKATRIYKTLGDQSGYYTGLTEIAACLTNIGDYDSAVALYETALPVMSEQSPTGAANIKTNLGLAHLYNGDTEQARLCFQETLELCANLGDTYGMCFAATCLGELYYLTANMDSSAFYFKFAHGNAEQLGFQDSRLWSEVYLAAIHASSENLDQGIAELKRLSAEAEENQLMEIYIMSRRLLGQVMLEYGLDDAARAEGRAILIEAKDLAEKQSIVHETRRISTLLEST
jgi:serine/threonine protein kinase/tetratricopeptide (TPR) repeat protein